MNSNSHFKSIDTFPEGWKKTQANETAVSFPDRSLTWKEFSDEIDNVRNMLRGYGLAANDHIGVMLPNSADNAVALLAIMAAGATAVPISLRFKEDELKFILHDSNIRLLMTAGPGARGEWSADQSLLPLLNDDVGTGEQPAIMPAAPNLRDIVWLSGVKQYAGGLDRDAFAKFSDETPFEVQQRDEIAATDIAIIMYTSGTTSRPKGAMISHHALVVQAKAIGELGFELQSDSRLWTPLPMFHTGGIMTLLACIVTGSSYFHSGMFDARAALNILVDNKITVAVPVFEPLWLPVLELPEFATADLYSLQIVQTAGVPEAQRKMQERLPTAINIQSSGMTETTSYFAINNKHDSVEVRLGTGGFPLPTFEVRIVDTESGEICGVGQRGETQIRGEGLFSGYYNSPEITMESFTEDGWFKTGDAGVIDSDGRYTFVDRIKDMLKVGGENVAAAEIEDYLSQHPAIRLVQVVAAPDSIYGEVPAAFIELREGASDTTEDDIIDFCREKIAKFKVPRYIRYVNEWPMSGTKIRKVSLRDRIAEELSMCKS